MGHEKDKEKKVQEEQPMDQTSETVGVPEEVFESETIYSEITPGMRMDDEDLMAEDEESKGTNERTKRQDEEDKAA